MLSEEEAYETTAHLLETNGESRLEIEQHATTERDHGRICGLLYTSHFLSAWNARIFEFGAFIFLANIFPQTLLPASVYAFVRGAGAALLSPWIGAYLDNANRLQAVRLSIVGQRVSVAVSCVVLFLLAQYHWLRDDPVWSIVLLTSLCLLATVEKLSSVLNTISVERDWVVVVAGGHENRLRLLNAQMRRVDLFCKLVGPLVIALIDGASTRVAVMSTCVMTASSVLVEYFTIARVYHSIPELALPRDITRNAASKLTFQDRFISLWSGIVRYVNHDVFLPSISLALLYLSVLSFSGQLITYLLALGLSSSLVGVLRGISAVFELSATWIAPETTKHIGAVRAGIWFLTIQALCVTVACVILWWDARPLVTAFGTVSAVIVSRVGLWGFDLCAQLIVQEEVEADSRGTFSSQEMALQNAFEMLAFASTIAFPRPAQFKYPATMSATAVGAAGVLYAAFVRNRRGHLVHLSRCIDRKTKDHGHWYSMLLEGRWQFEQTGQTNERRFEPQPLTRHDGS